MLNINLVYIYPKIIEINNEIHLLRIIDQKLKESLVLYCIKEDNVYKIKFKINNIKLGIICRE